MEQYKTSSTKNASHFSNNSNVHSQPSVDDVTLNFAENDDRTEAYSPQMRSNSDDSFSNPSFNENDKRLRESDLLDIIEKKKRQNREAQRAYRQRRTTKISVLEQQVDELQNLVDTWRNKYQVLKSEYENQERLISKLQTANNDLMQQKNVPLHNIPPSEEDQVKNITVQNSMLRNIIEDFKPMNSIDLKSKKLNPDMGKQLSQPKLCGACAEREKFNKLQKENVNVQNKFTPDGITVDPLPNPTIALPDPSTWSCSQNCTSLFDDDTKNASDKIQNCDGKCGKDCSKLLNANCPGASGISCDQKMPPNCSGACNKECNGKMNPTCTKCNDDIESKMFCMAVKKKAEENQDKTDPPKPGEIYIPLAEGHRKIKEHMIKTMELVSNKDDMHVLPISSVISGLTTRGDEVELKSVTDVIKAMDQAAFGE